MSSNVFGSSLIKPALAASALLLSSGAVFAQQQVNLTAAPTTATLPDGSTVPMWGYSCGAVVSGSTATCAKLNPAATGWSPVVITVPTGQSLTVNLTNNLSFPPGSTTPTNTVPTSLVIVGQLGGGLGTTATSTPSPDHTNAQPLTWPIAGDPPGGGLTGVGTPPPQGSRVQSFSTEVAAGATTALTWTAPRPGTYLLESGTHPSIQGPMGLYGMLVVTCAPTDTTSGCTTGTAYSGVSYNADVSLLLSEIDPVQNDAVDAAVNTVGFSETMVWSGQPGGCGNPSSTTYHQCYPPAVNYTPLYYLFNGVAFDKSNPSLSLFAAYPGTSATPVTGSVLVRFVNAGLRMHVPSIVGSQTGTPAVSGFSLIAEDGNPLPGVPRVQSEVFLPAGKTHDVMINVPATVGSALPAFDRELSLSGNATARDAGMLAYIGINGAGLPSTPAFASAVANPDTYNSVIAGQTLTVSDPAKGVIANDVNIYGVQVVPGSVIGGTLTLNTDGTFKFVATAASGSFQYCGNGKTSGPACTTVTLGAAPIEAGTGITVKDDSYTSNVATSLSITSPGVLANDMDAAGYPLTVATSTVVAGSGLTLSVDKSGAFNASAAPGTYTFTYKAQNSQGTVSARGGLANDGIATVTLIFPAPSNLAVSVVDGRTRAAISDYRWIIEEDRTFYIDPKCTANPPPAGCPTAASGIVPTFGTNFHTSYMPLVAAGCTGPLSCESGQTIFDPTTGLHVNTVCDIGNGVCRTTGSQETPVDPKWVHLDPTKRYYLSVLPGDAANPFIAANLSACLPTTDPNYDPSQCGHGMGGAPIAAGQTAVTVLAQPTPFPPSKLSVFVFQDDFPLNGEHDSGGGIDVLATNEPGLGGFNITLFDDAGGTGDATGQMTYDMFNQPLSNSLAGTIDPRTGLDACPIVQNPRTGTNPDGSYDKTQTGITGTIVTCPKFEAGGIVLSPLAGQAVIANLMPGRYGVVATPGADRIARGEEWLQTNTLDGQKAHDSFLRIGEPSYFQEFGPAGFHVSIGFASPQVINNRLAGVCSTSGDGFVTGTNCTHTVTGMVTTERMSRTPDQRLYSSGDNSSFAFTQCYVSLGDTDGEDFAFTKCNADGTFTLTGIPDGNWRITVFDQWNDMLVDGLSTPVGLGPGFAACPGPATSGTTCDMGQIAMNQWQANIYTKSFFDQNGNGIQDGLEAGLTLVPTNIRFRDGSYSNFNNTDLAGNAGFNEIFPLFSWYVVESDSTRYKNTGTHVVYDSGGPADGTTGGGTSGIGANLANTQELVSVPANLRVPGAFYCANADCTDAATPFVPGGTGGTTGRIDPPMVHPYGSTYGWQGFSGQNSFLEFGKKPFAAGENGGIRGEVIYASTRPFDDPALLIHTSWTPDVPGVTVNLYQVGTAPDGSQSLKLVDTTKTSSWDDWAQGFHLAADGVTKIPNMNCPGQGRDTGVNADLFFFTLYNQPMSLDFYSSQHGGPTPTALPSNSQFKCYDGMHNWNQLQPAPYDGMYQFPSVTGIDPATGKPNNTNCTICGPNPDSSDPFRVGTPMLPSGKYVVEVVVPPGYELVKEEDKNILIGDNYIAPVTVQFPGLAGAVYILPDQAEVAAGYNANNAQNPTQAFGRTTFASHEGDTGSVETFWPCVGQARIVPDYISLFPQSHEVAPFAGALRNLCDRKEVMLDDQTSALAKFWIFSSTHVAAHFTGVITDDFTSEFDPFSPQFGEKFSPPNMPIAFKDWTGNEISRVYTDQWGTYNGLNYSTWEVNPPNPTGYAPTMMVTCMNDPGTGATPDPLFNPQYSQFCYEIPFMPGQTQYMDTPVVPTSGFVGAGYNNPDTNYPDGTPAISEVDGTGIGPWVSGPGLTLTIHALGDVVVPNYGYSGPSASTAPFNQKTVTRHYGFGTGGTVALVGSDGVSHPLTGVTWSDLTITGTVPGNVPNCTIQQQAQYGGSAARCGQLVIKRADTGQQSIDTVTVTIGGKAPTHVTAGGSIQSAIDAAAPGDLIIVNPGVYNELLVMWKPVRLQGVGAASSVINANTHPAGKLDPWRARINCLFGLALNGQPYSLTTPVPPATSLNPYDSTGASSCPAAGWAFFNADGGSNDPQVDRMPLEGIVGWDVTVNGNLAEMLQEPSLMGAYEGAGITVLAKGVRIPPGGFVFGNGNDSGVVATEAQFPVGTVLLSNSNADCNTQLGPVASQTGYASNFQCNPSRIDGLSVTDSSQGGGGIFLHAWAHNLEISNNRVYNNIGTLSGGISVGQPESPDALLIGNNGNPPGFDQQPWTCLPGAVTGTYPNQVQQVIFGNLANNTQLPYCYNTHVNVHNNAIRQNASIGDEVFSGTPAGAGGISFSIGSDYYRFANNWVAGNLSTGDGGGVSHIGFIYNGDIEHNTILFNQSTNPTIATNGGGIIVMGAAPDGNTNGGLECGSVTDVDCAPGLSDGTGPGLVINANLIMGNAAEAGSGGGIRFQSVNGTEVVNFPLGPLGMIPSISPGWNSVTVTNNIIANNVAGWDGGGVSLQDALVVNFVNNTVMSNDSTASSGVLFNTLGAPLASAPGDTNQTTSSTTSAPQAAGLVSMQNTSLLQSALAAEPAVLGVRVLCPPGHASGTLANGNCIKYSVPLLYNDVFWQNRSFYIGVGSLGSGTLNQQHVVALFNALTTTQAASQPSTDATTANGTGVIVTGGTGACTPGATYWDLGVRGDTGPTNHGSGLTLAPNYSVLSTPTGSGGNNTTANPTVLSQYCNGSRIPPEFRSMGYQVPPGISDATVPNPIFSLTPAATVDEGNNWINISWGPLAQRNPVINTLLGNYGPASTSSVINYIPSSAVIAYMLAPALDFYGNARKTNNAVDAGAVEFVAAGNTPMASVTGGPLAFGNVVDGTTSPPQTLTLHNTGTAPVTGITLAFSSPSYSRPAGAAGGTCGAMLIPVATCTINVVFSPGTNIGEVDGNLTITANVGVTGSPVLLTGAGVAAVRSASVAPSPLAFGSWATGTTSNARTLTVTNTGNASFTGVTVTGFAAPFSRPAGAAGGTCTTTITLAVGGTCTINALFAPTTTGSFTDNLTVSSTGVTVTPAPVVLTGTGVASRATVSITPNPLTITLPVGVNTGTGTVTLTNAAPAGTGASMTVSSVSITNGTGGSLGTWFFNGVSGQDTCTGATLAPGGTCTVGVRFTNVLSPRGANRNGTITFTDNAQPTPSQSGALVGFASTAVAAIGGPAAP